MVKNYARPADICLNRLHDLLFMFGFQIMNIAANSAAQMFVIARSGSDEAIQGGLRGPGLLRFARNDGYPCGYPEI